MRQGCMWPRSAGHFLTVFASYWKCRFLDAFAKLQKSNYWLRHVCSSVCVRPPEWKRLSCHWTDFYESWYLNIFRKFIEWIQDLLKSDKNNGTVLYMKTNIHLWPYLAQFFLEWETVQTKSVEKNRKTFHEK